MSIATDIADAVAAELNSGSFSQSFTAARLVLPRFELKDLAELKVSVVPKSLDMTGATRAASQYAVSVDVGIQKRVHDMETETAQLGDLVDEIADFLRKRPLSETPFAAWATTQNDPVYDPQHLDQHRVFTSVLSVTYKMLRGD